MSELNELAEALAKAQGKIHPAPKDADNPFFKSKYASLPAIREAMKDAFAENGLSVVQIPEVIDGQLRLKTLLLHESGQSLDCGVLAVETDMANPQKMGSAITYFRRYALAAISQTVADEDDDGNTASGKPKPKPVELSADELALISTTLDAIKHCKTLDDLSNIGQQIKDDPPHIQEKLRKPYGTRKKELSI